MQSVRKNPLTIGTLPALLWGEEQDKAVLAVHGQGGSKEEAALLAQVVCPLGWQVLSVDLPGHGERAGKAPEFLPWNCVPELRQAKGFLQENWRQKALYAVSIGAWLSLLSFHPTTFSRCLLVSPLLDMEGLILSMMKQAGVTESRLRKEQIIPAASGQDLSWEYLTYARAHPAPLWPCPTSILYGEGDSLVPLASVRDFAQRNACSLTNQPGGEHWFHTPEQLDDLKGWIGRKMDFPKV